ncbi:MAG: hypothetical protein V4736_02695 [Bdellovibrionota bacterium]
MKVFLSVLVLMSSTVALANMKPVTGELRCEADSGFNPDGPLVIPQGAPINIGGSNGSDKAIVTISSTSELTTIVITPKNEGAGLLPRIFKNPTSLTVGFEGITYIQQVSNELGYNLYLDGAQLNDLLGGKPVPAAELSGDLTLLNINGNKSYTLTSCKGSLK